MIESYIIEKFFKSFKITFPYCTKHASCITSAHFKKASTQFKRNNVLRNEGEEY